MVQVSITEMYDLATTQNKIGIVGIHSPDTSSVARRWFGLYNNYRFMRLVKCDISVACASVLPADPLQVGYGSDQVAPQDMMNPILYRACTNESWNVVLNRFYASSGMTDVNSTKYATDGFANLTDSQQENLYYALLSESGWRKAMPQAGLSMTGLRPFVFQVYNTYGNTNIPIPGTTTNVGSYLDTPYNMAETAAGNTYPMQDTSNTKPITFRGPAVPMPRVPCTQPGSNVPTATSGTFSPYPWMIPSPFPKTYVGCLVIPPNKSGNVMYFRMIVRWTIEFTDLVSSIEKESANSINGSTTEWYTRTYSLPTSSKDVVTDGSDDKSAETGSIDALNTDLDLVMEK